MSLLERQIAFRAEIAADDDAPPSLSPGMAIYRNAYRGRLLEALAVSFERTRRWVGEEPFFAAACHYILTAPPTGWTLDDYGADFPTLLAELFAGDPEVAELAWLEWHRQQAFAAPDRPVLGTRELLAVGYTDGDWDGLTFRVAAGVAMRPIATNCTALWDALGEDEFADFAVADSEGSGLLVWRAGLSPHFRTIMADEWDALNRIAGGAPLGRLAEHEDPAELGAWLARWLADGLFSTE